MHKGNTIDRLITAAFDLFSVKGYSGTSVEEVAKLAGIKAPTMYKYLSGKEELLQILGERFDEEYKKGMNGNTVGIANVHTAAEYKEFCLRGILFAIENEMFAKARRMSMLEQFRDPYFAERATKYQITEQQAIHTALIRRLIDEGAMIKGDPEIIALEYIAPGTLMIQMCDRQPEKKEEALAIVSKHLDTINDRYFLKK